MDKTFGNSSIRVNMTLLTKWLYNTNVTSNINASSPELCWTVMTRFENKRSVERFMFFSFAVFGFLATMINSLVINGIKKTNQNQNKSTRLILYISACDVTRVVISYTCISIAIVFKSSMNCALRYIMVFVAYFWIYITAYFFTLVALDRYLRVALQQNYQGNVTESRFKKGVAVVILLGTYQGLTLCFGPFIIGKENTAFGVVLVNIIMFLATIILYLLSIKRLRQIATNNIISNETRKITTMASAYLIIYFISYMPVILYLVMSKVIFKNPDIQNTGIIRIITYLAQDLMSMVTAALFLFRNRQCFRYYKEKIMDMKRHLVQSNDVSPLE